jgi:predicted nucleotidyltransferase
MRDIEAVVNLAVERGRRALDPANRPERCPARFVFVTVSGAHLYGFPSPDSDIDLRGAHLLPLRAIIGLRSPDETVDIQGARIEGVELDCVSHDLGKYLRLLTRKNGYVLEQIFSPLVVFDGGRLEELRALARGAMTRHLVHHYKGFFATQEKLVLKSPAPTAKALLYLFRVAMTGIHVLRTGEVEANLARLNESIFRLPFIGELMERKMTGGEKGLLPEADFKAAYGEAKMLEAQLDEAFASSPLPDEVRNLDALDDFLVRMRLEA